MPDLDGFAVLRQLKCDKAATRVVVLSALHDEDLIEALRLGAHGIILKHMAPRLIVQCVRTVHAGKQWVEKGVATHAVSSLLKREAGLRAMATVLTPREIEVARLIANGLSSKAVANELAISEGTTKLHLHHDRRETEPGRSRGVDTVYAKSGLRMIWLVQLPGSKRKLLADQPQSPSTASTGEQVPRNLGCLPSATPPAPRALQDRICFAVG